jgi:hypothetical protein
MMDERFMVRQEPRAGTADNQAALPLVTIAWRAMRDDYAKRRQEGDSLKDGLLEVAGEVRRLCAAHKAQAAGIADGDQARKSLESAANTLERILAGLGVTIIAPQGEPYTLERMQLFESIAQTSRLGLLEPTIEEIVEPAIFYRGSLCQMGKAVIALPMDIGSLDIR